MLPINAIYRKCITNLCNVIKSIKQIIFAINTNNYKYHYDLKYVLYYMGMFILIHVIDGENSVYCHLNIT